MEKEKIVIIGKIPPPYYGPAIATEIILNSKLKNYFHLNHLDSRVNSDLNSMGKINLRKIGSLFKLYFNSIKIISNNEVKLMLLPIGQSSSALYKDSLLIVLGFLFNKKIIIHLRGSALSDWFKNTNRFNKFYFKSLFKKVSAAIVLGNKLKYIFEPFLSEDKIYVVPNGANYSFPERKKNTSDIKITYLGNLQASKGITGVVDAFTLLESSSQNIRLDIVGAWRGRETREYCQSKIKQNNYNINFKTPTKGIDKLDILINSDVFIFTPRAPEGHPWVIVEAMAAGLPIISTDQGAITESVLDGVNGFIVPSHSPKKIAEKINYLLEHPVERRRMGAESRRLYEQYFTEDKMVEKLAEVFKKVINKPKQTRY